MSGSQVADMVSEDGKKGVGKSDKLFTDTFHRRHLLVMIVLSFAILFSFTFFPKNGGRDNLKKLKNHIPKVVIQAHHECVIIEHTAFIGTTLIFNYNDFDYLLVAHQSYTKYVDDNLYNYFKKFLYFYCLVQACIMTSTKYTVVNVN